MNQFFVYLPASFAMYYTFQYTQPRWNIGFRLDPELPSLRELVVVMAFNVVMNEVWFYFGHLAFHKYGYKYHKVHHEFKAPVALVAAYAHPLETLLVNLLSVTAGLMLVNAHILLVWLYLVVGTMTAQTHHCGYRFPWTLPWDDEPDFHDFHHEKFEVNYGLLGWLDRLFNTDAAWRARKRELAAAAAAEGNKKQQ
eukprot:TRINITY_DN66564_c12_g3_i1.p2 TRINITY_DN66564_c12_g3~~TRINITY_DN66564_c12_g3_i1.p2  ORF type:complete len:196 (+),score=87.46 TRINITY_DN66564_c12_g3_i1:131-718(+)